MLAAAGHTSAATRHVLSISSPTRAASLRTRSRRNGAHGCHGRRHLISTVHHVSSEITDFPRFFLGFLPILATSFMVQFILLTSLVLCLYVCIYIAIYENYGENCQLYMEKQQAISDTRVHHSATTCTWSYTPY